MKKVLKLLLLLTTTTSFSQIKYEPGYFISNNGNKTECLIRNIAWKNTPETFDYKLNESSEPQTGSIANTKEFGVGSAYRFTRFIVDIDKSSDFTDRLSPVREPQYVKDTVFLKTLVAGRATLYHYEEPGIVKYFYSTDNHSEAIQLYRKRYADKGYIKEDNNYRQQLFLLMKDKMPQVSRYEKIKYKKDPLVKVFMEYNGENAKNLEEKHLQGNLNLKVIAGAGIASLSMKNYYTIKHDFKKSPVYIAGAELEYVFPFNKNKWSMFVSPNLQFYNGTSSDEKINYEAKYSTFQLGVGGRHYMFLTDKSKIFINASYNFSFLINDNYIKYNKSQLKISKTSSPSIGAGFNNGPYSIELRHTLSHGITEYHFWAINYSTTAVILSFNFL